MKNEELKSAYNAVIYIISCALANREVDKELISHVPIGAIYSAAARHSLDALVTTALEAVGIVSKRAAELKMQSVRKNIMFDNERERLLSRFEERGIKYLPLKGIILKDLYPAVGLRQMADNDILFDSSFRKEVREIMVDDGYEISSFGLGHHDIYLKKPTYNFELHVSLFSRSGKKVFYDYYSDVFERARSDGKSKFGYLLSDEDFYVYLKAHEYKHYTDSGTGLRSLVDVFVYLSKKENTLDMNYISSECEALGISRYEEKTRLLAKKIFDPDIAIKLVEGDRGACLSPLEADESDFLYSFVDSATYGTNEKMVENIVNKQNKGKNQTTSAKLRYILGLVFPPLEFYEDVYPGAMKKKYLIPFLWIRRCFAIIFKRPKKAFSKVSRVIKTKIDK